MLLYSTDHVMARFILYFEKVKISKLKNACVEREIKCQKNEERKKEEEDTAGKTKVFVAFGEEI